ncbi:MAG TPA: hypothetical protein VFQ35_02275 [Polyangiaceae bacterium]|nr:hypothetical protein [Polyangiaceae bacterium]
MANREKKSSRTARPPAPARKRTRRASPDHVRGCSEEEANELVRRLNEKLVLERVPGRVNRLRSALRSTDHINVEALGRHESWSVPLHSCFVSLSHGSLNSKTTALLKMRAPARCRMEDVRAEVAELEPSLVYEGASQLLLSDRRPRYPRDKKQWDVRDSFELAQDLANLPDINMLGRAPVVSLFSRIGKECAWLDRMSKPDGRRPALRLQTAIARDLCTVKKDAFNDDVEIDSERFSLDEAVEIVRLPKDATNRAFRASLNKRLERFAESKALEKAALRTKLMKLDERAAKSGRDSLVVKIQERLELRERRARQEREAPQSNEAAHGDADRRSRN